MSDDTAAQASAQATDGDKGGQSGTYTPPATQDELNRMIADRVSRERAKFADYSDLKAKATAHDAFVEAQKTEAQKVADRLAAAEAKVQEFETEKQAAILRKEVSKATGVPADALRGNTKEELEAHAATLKTLITPADGKRPAVGPYVPPEGSAPSGAVQAPGDIFAEFMNDALKRP